MSLTHLEIWRHLSCLKTGETDDLITWFKFACRIKRNIFLKKILQLDFFLFHFCFVYVFVYYFSEIARPCSAAKHFCRRILGVRVFWHSAKNTVLKIKNHKNTEDCDYRILFIFLKNIQCIEYQSSVVFNYNCSPIHIFSSDYNISCFHISIVILKFIYYMIK